MDRRSFIGAACACVIMSPRAWCAAPRLRDADEDSIYTAVLNAQCPCCADKRAVVLIQTTPFVPNVPHIELHDLTPLQKAMASAKGRSPSLKPPPDRITDAEDLIRGMQRQSLLTPPSISISLPIKTPHRFIDERQTKQFFIMNPQSGIFSPRLAAQAKALPAFVKRQLRHADTIWSLSPVSFNEAHNLALVAFRSNGGGCMTEAWIALEQRDSGWRALDWPNASSGYCT